MCEKLLRIIFCASFRIVNRKADASSSVTFCFFFGHLLFYFPTRFGQIFLLLPHPDSVSSISLLSLSEGGTFLVGVALLVNL